MASAKDGSFSLANAGASKIVRVPFGESENKCQNKTLIIMISFFRINVFKCFLKYI